MAGPIDDHLCVVLHALRSMSSITLSRSGGGAVGCRKHGPRKGEAGAWQIKRDTI